MTAVSDIDRARLSHEQLENASPDRMRHVLSTVIEALMGAGSPPAAGGTPAGAA